ncbi:hypothetical protein ACXYRQ_00425 [Mycoplasma sp. 394]
MQKNYQEIYKHLSKSQIPLEDFKKTRLFSYLSNLGYQLSKFKNMNQKSLYYIHFTSFCNIYQPNKIRLRNDSFLDDVINKKDSILVAGYRENKDVYLVFMSKSFFGYNKQVSVSNSFILMEYSDLKNKILPLNSDVILPYWIKKNKQSKIKYLYYVTSNDFDEEIFDNFKETVNKMNFNPYSENIEIQNSLINKGPKINQNEVLKIRSFWNYKCALISSNYDYKCPLGENIDIDKLNNYGLSYVDIHHIVPKWYFIKYFKDKGEIIDWNMIHSSTNLIPLCAACHTGIHKGSSKESIKKELSFKIINSLYNNLFNKNIQSDFDSFIIKNTDIKEIKKLFEIYTDELWRN